VQLGSTGATLSEGRWRGRRERGEREKEREAAEREPGCEHLSCQDEQTRCRNAKMSECQNAENDALSNVAGLYKLCLVWSLVVASQRAR
jgi:hypothetical protein